MTIPMKTDIAMKALVEGWNVGLATGCVRVESECDIERWMAEEASLADRVDAPAPTGRLAGVVTYTVDELAAKTVKLGEYLRGGFHLQRRTL